MRALGNSNFFNNVMESVKDIDDITLSRLGEITAIVPALMKGAYLREFVMPPGEPLPGQPQLDTVERRARRMALLMGTDPFLEHSPFWKAKAPLTKRIQDFIKTLSPQARDLLFTSMVYVFHHRGDGTGAKERTLLKPPEEWEKTGKISFPEPLQGRGRVRLRGGINVAFPPTEGGRRDFLDWVNRNWNATITKIHRDARPAHFKKVFTDTFPFSKDKPFRPKPRYYIVYNTRTKNVRVRQIDFSQPSDDDFMALQFGVPIHKRDYNDFFKDSLAPPTQQFAEVLQNAPAPAPAPAEGQGRVRGGWIPTNTELVQMPTEEIEQIAEDDAEFNYLIAQQQFLRTGRNKPKEPRKRAPRGNACADTSIRRKKPPPPPPPTGMLVGTAKPKSFAKAMKELMAKQ